MDIVDSQVHLGPGRIADTITAMDALGIQAVLIDEFWLSVGAAMPSHVLPNGVARAATPTAELASLTHPDRFSYIVRVDRRDPELASILRLARDAPHARGLRIAPGISAGEIAALAAGDYDTLFANAADCGLPVFVAIPGHAPLLARYAKKFSALKLVVDHCGMPFGAELTRKLTESGVAELDDMPAAQTVRATADIFGEVLRLADCPNIALKWGHAQGLFGVTGYPFAGLRPILRRALDAFGPDRVMWASDIGANQTGETWAELLFWLIDNPDLSRDEREGILGRAVRMWLQWSV